MSPINYGGSSHVNALICLFYRVITADAAEWVSAHVNISRGHHIKFQIVEKSRKPRRAESGKLQGARNEAESAGQVVSVTVPR